MRIVSAWCAGGTRTPHNAAGDAALRDATCRARDAAHGRTDDVLPPQRDRTHDGADEVVLLELRELGAYSPLSLGDAGADDRAGSVRAYLGADHDGLLLCRQSVRGGGLVDATRLRLGQPGGYVVNLESVHCARRMSSSDLIARRLGRSAEGILADPLGDVCDGRSANPSAAIGQRVSRIAIRDMAHARRCAS
jgi:hypothetical protein